MRDAADRTEPSCEPPQIRLAVVAVLIHLVTDHVQRLVMQPRQWRQQGAIVDMMSHVQSLVPELHGRLKEGIADLSCNSAGASKTTIVAPDLSVTKHRCMINSAADLDDRATSSSKTFLFTRSLLLNGVQSELCCHNNATDDRAAMQRLVRAWRYATTIDASLRTLPPSRLSKTREGHVNFDT